MTSSSPVKAMAASLLLTFGVSCSAAEPMSANDFVGFWELSFDEDGSPKDTMEIRADGTYISHGWSCRTSEEAPYHLHNGDLYVTFEMPEKGPVAIVFRKVEDGRLSFTSPRTRNNAYYARLEKNPCP
jgi:hypothetical protein